MFNDFIISHYKSKVGVLFVPFTFSTFWPVLLWFFIEAGKKQKQILVDFNYCPVKKADQKANQNFEKKTNYKDEHNVDQSYK